jgi:hypothetical protein
VNVVIAFSTLIGADDQPGELNGHPIPARLARLLAADPTGTWRRLVTDEMGVLRDYGRTRYRPPADLANFVRARDRECVFPTCTRRADTCDLDHRTEWANGGHTNEPNIDLVSPRHHHARHEGGWNKQRLPDGSIQWTSPTGHYYTKPPATYPIDHTSLPDVDDPGYDPEPPPF